MHKNIEIIKDNTSEQMKIISKISFIIGLFLFSFIIINLCVTSGLYVLKITMTKFNILVSYALTIILGLLVFRKDKLKTSHFLYSVLISTFLIIVSIIISTFMYDFSYDGNFYHKVSVGSLKNGWNPLYESIGIFNKSEKNSMKLPETFSIWNDHYAKGYQFFAASIYSLTHNIESGKCLQLIFMATVFFIIFSYLYECVVKKFLLSMFVSILFVLNPITIVQLFTYYNDGLLGLGLIILIFSLIMINDNKYLSSDKFKWYLYILSLIFLINIKFTGFIYAGFYSVCFFIWSIVKSFKIKEYVNEIKKFIISGIIGLIIGVLFVGSSTYIKNLYEHKNPFYPLIGKEKVDIISYNQPNYFTEKSTIEKFVISMFSEVDDPFGEKTAHYKMPFTIKKAEFGKLGYAGTRISGFGILYSGIYILTITIFVYSFIKYGLLKHISIYIPIFATTALIFILSESWWARYIPQLYMITIFAFILLLLDIGYKKSIYKILNVSLFAILISINVWFFINSAVLYGFSRSRVIHKDFDLLKREIKKDNNIKFNISRNEFPGAWYNYYDYTNNLYLVDKIEDENSLIMKSYFIEISKRED